jgi:hypothetical protein
MIPPAWALKDSARLDLGEFRAEFSGAWSRVGSRFLKLECWQQYREHEASQSQDEYNRGDIARARELLGEEAEADRPLYEDVRRRGIDYARIRLVQQPLTPYLRYELMAYEIRARMGENIEVVRWGPDLKLPDEDHFDFLLFDGHTALIHDYGSGEVGLQTGGWITYDADAIASLENRATALRQMAIPLPVFLGNNTIN